MSCSPEHQCSTRDEEAASVCCSATAPHHVRLKGGLLCENKIDVCGVFLFISTHTEIDFLSARTLRSRARRLCALHLVCFFSTSADTRDMARRIHDIILLITSLEPHCASWNARDERNRLSRIKRIQLKAILPPWYSSRAPDHVGGSWCFLLSLHQASSAPFVPTIACATDSQLNCNCQQWWGSQKFLLQIDGAINLEVFFAESLHFQLAQGSRLDHVTRSNRFPSDT